MMYNRKRLSGFAYAFAATSLAAFSLLAKAETPDANVTSAVNVFSYAATNVTTSAYVTIVASSPAHAQRMYICDNSGHFVRVAAGAAGNEKDLFTTPLNGCQVFDFFVPAGTRLSAKSLPGDTSSTTGFNAISFFP